MDGLAVLIVGMHRSGTSSLAGSLQQLGLYLGDVQERNPWNPRGNRENLEIMHLHDEVLAANGGSWDRPPPVVKWSPEHRRRRDEIIATYTGHERWGFKDPRTLLTVDGWLETLPEPAFVGTFRHPRAVAESIQRRNGGELADWIELWASYNTRLLQLHAAFTFPLVDFDMEPEAYRRRLADVAAGLGLQPSGGDGFFEPELRHEAAEPAGLPGRAREIYAALVEAAA